MSTLIAPNPAERRILKAILDHWLTKNEWPLERALTILGLTEDFDFERYKQSPSPFMRKSRFSPPDRYALTMEGFALFPQGQAVVRVFLGVARHLARLLIKDCTRRPELTRRTLGKLAKTSDPTEIHRLTLAIFDQDFPWENQPGDLDSDWEALAGVTMLYFDKVRTLAEFHRLRQPSRQIKLGLDSEHIRHVRRLATHWKRKGTWPLGIKYVVKHRAFWTIWEINRNYLYDTNFGPGDERPIQLTLNGLWASGNSDRELGQLLRIVRACLDYFIMSKGKRWAPIDLIASSVHLSENRVERLVAAGFRDGTAIRIDKRDGKSVIGIEDYITQFKTVKSLREFQMRRGAMGEFGGDPMTDESIERLLLRFFSEQPEDGSKALNRWNLAGKKHSRGQVEMAVGRELSEDERFRVKKAIDRLEAHEYVRSSMRDVLNPEDWLIMTAKGRANLNNPPSSNPKKFLLFISYNCGDTDHPVLRLISSTVEAAVTPLGGEVYMAEDKPQFGEGLIKEVRSKLDRATIVLPFVTANSLNRPWVEQEIGYSVAKGWTIMPVFDGDEMSKPPGMLEDLVGCKIKDSKGVQLLIAKIIDVAKNVHPK